MGQAASKLKPATESPSTAGAQDAHIKHILSISRELNGERDIPRLLNLILRKAREVTKADAGSIYQVEYDRRNPANIREGLIHFSFTQNDSVAQNLSAFSMPVTEKSIVGGAVLQGVVINIPDLYQLSSDPAVNPSGWTHDRRWDRQTGYECHSMLTVPLYNISHQIIGVVQLINRKLDPSAKLLKPDDFAEHVIPFDEQDQEYAQIVAQQAGIALENAQLAKDKEDLFEGFVQASVTAIEQRDPTTSGHSNRVASLTLGLADLITAQTAGPFRAVRFSSDEMRELKYASLLHDFGKLGVREKVLVKAKKLDGGEFDVVKERFESIRASLEISYLRKRLQLLELPPGAPISLSLEELERERDFRLRELDDVISFVEQVNEPTVLEQGGFERLTDIANLAFVDTRGRKRPYLATHELQALAVSRGSLTREEFVEIQNHVTHTYEFLRKIPWGVNLANVPQIAAKHHEKLDGSGYPNGAMAHEIPLQTRVMTVADIFDALTAADRPYKKAVPIERALDILQMEVKAGKCDPNVLQLFVESRIYEKLPTSNVIP